LKDVEVSSGLVLAAGHLPDGIAGSGLLTSLSALVGGM
jgi:hypothetical protein